MHRNRCTCLLNLPRDGDSTSALGSLTWQKLDNPFSKDFFLILNLNLCSWNLKSFPCVLVLVSKEESWKGTGREKSKGESCAYTRSKNIQSPDCKVIYLVCVTSYSHYVLCQENGFMCCHFLHSLHVCQVNE